MAALWFLVSHMGSWSFSRDVSPRQGTLSREVRKSDELGGTGLPGELGSLGKLGQVLGPLLRGYQVGESHHLLQ